MALNKDVLGGLLNTAANNYNDVAIDTTDPAAMNAYRLNYWKDVADVIINHIKAAAVVTVTVTTTGTASNHTGGGTGNIT